MKYSFEKFKYMASAQQFKITFLMILIANAYGIFGLALRTSYYDGFFAIMTNKYYIVLLFIIFLLNSVNTNSMVEENYSYILRLESKSKYIIELLKSVAFNNMIIFLIIIMTLLTGLNIFNPQGNSIYYHNDINIWIYIIFYILRVFVILQIISSISVLFLKIFGLRFVIIINVLFYASLIANFSRGDTITSVFNMSLMVGDYFSLSRYTSFTLELWLSILFTMFLLSVLLVLLQIAKNHLRQIGG